MVVASCFNFLAYYGKRTNSPTAKVGPTKAPDYVVLDNAGKWHVLECKGTQSGAGTRDGYLNDALSQKQVILLKGALRGEQLAAGLSISHEDQRRDSSLRVVDPEVDPVLTLESTQEAEIKSKINRLSMARALGMIGLNDASMEFSLPPDVLKGKEYLQGAERRRARSTAQDRSARGSDQLRSRELTHFSFESREYEGRTALIELPELGRNAPFNAVMVRQGVNGDVLNELASTPSLFRDEMDGRIKARLSDSVVKFISDERSTILTHGEVLFSEIVLKRL